MRYDVLHSQSIPIHSIPSCTQFSGSHEQLLNLCESYVRTHKKLVLPYAAEIKVWGRVKGDPPLLLVQTPQRCNEKCNEMWSERGMGQVSGAKGRHRRKE